MKENLKLFLYKLETIFPMFKAKLRARVMGGKIFFGKRTRLCFSSNIRVSKGAVFRAGDDFLLGENCVINLYPNARFTAASNVSFTSHDLVYCKDSIFIAHGVGFAPYCFLVDFNHSYKARTVEEKRVSFDSKPVTIEDNVWVGAHSCLLRGVSIGAHSVIGANSTVTRHIPECCVAVGSPARVIKRFELVE